MPPIRTRNTNEFLFCHILVCRTGVDDVQESLPMTEDMLEEHAEMLTQLGSDAEGSQLRARILSASLYSDMEAFKVGAFHSSLFAKHHRSRSSTRG